MYFATCGTMLYPRIPKMAGKYELDLHLLNGVEESRYLIFD